MQSLLETLRYPQEIYTVLSRYNEIAFFKLSFLSKFNVVQPRMHAFLTGIFKMYWRSTTPIMKAVLLCIDCGDAKHPTAAAVVTVCLRCLEQFENWCLDEIVGKLHLIISLLGKAATRCS